MREYNFWVYMVRCSDGSLYTGITNSVKRRLYQHNEGRNPNCYTYSRRPVELVYAAHFDYVLDAISWEKKVKRWSRKKKEALIKRDWDKIEELAKCKNVSENFRPIKIRKIKYLVRGKTCVILRQGSG
ncbi:TPA: hypothetical protein DE059_01360 [Candidatus Peribacteria bacterium]|nr:hypothetical protein [Candidatus Peribacteria bacterium]|tara:strand:+ start:101 stop:484 length:384 start_codon:yes stop_codon:yes gene_type:complete